MPSFRRSFLHSRSQEVRNQNETDSDREDEIETTQHPRTGPGRLFPTIKPVQVSLREQYFYLTTIRVTHIQRSFTNILNSRTPQLRHRSRFPYLPFTMPTSKKRSISEVSTIKYYAVRAGHTPGVYTVWADCQENITGFKGAQCKFPTISRSSKYLPLTMVRYCRQVLHH